MNTLQNKIDFAVIITATNANPNGDPLGGNRPRENFDGYGEISDVCIKRKIRNRLQDMGEKIFVQSDDRCDDGCDSLRKRAESNEALKAISKVLAVSESSLSQPQTRALTKMKVKMGPYIGILQNI